MAKKNKVIIGIVGLVLIVVGVIFVGGVGWYFWQLNRPGDLGKDDLTKDAPVNFKTYNNLKYAYSLSYPNSWFVGFLGTSEDQAEVIWFGPSELDQQETMGGEPAGVKFEIIAFDLPEMRAEAPDLPQIANIREWVDWQRSEWDQIQKDRIGEYTDTDIIVNGVAAIKTNFEPTATNPDLAEMVEVQVMDEVSERVYLLKYYGREPTYSENLEVLDDIVGSFTF